MAHSSDTRPKHMSSPISLHGVDITALDARDVCLGMPADFQLTDDSPRRQRHSPSLSAGRIPDPDPDPDDGPAADSRSRSLSTWIYPYRRPPGSSPSLSARAKDADDAACESASCLWASVSSADPQQLPTYLPSLR